MNKQVTSRPWGNFVRYTDNESTTIKIITILCGEELSLQYHNHRKEFWKVLSGHPTLTIGEEKVEALPGDEFEILEKMKHQISAPKDEVQILEISFGNFDETDIVRISDKYGRV
jgi:mannose-1-phosphate guanylyltransferase/mannose-1-phosphate guanylyltransferase/mannose-6-phosphate isomerase